MKNTQTTAPMFDMFLRSLCGRAPEAKRLLRSFCHRLEETRDRGIFIPAIALLAFSWLVAPTRALATADTNAPALTSAVMASAVSSSQITLRWNNSTDTGGSGLAGYRVYRNGSLVGTTASTGYTDTGLSPTTQYCYTIVAYDNSGNNASASAQACVTTPSGSVPNPSGPGYYVDYSAGSDSNPGTNSVAPWKHCPGDPSATGNAASTALKPGDTVYFKPGVQYVETSSYAGAAVWSGIVLTGGSQSNPIVYDGGLSTWGSGRAIITDNHSANHIAGFGGDTLHYGSPVISNVVVRNFEIGPIGGAASLPPDPGHGILSNPAWGIYSAGPMVNVTIANCYFHELGYWQNVAPIGGASLDGEAIHLSVGGTSVTITNCEITKCHTGIELMYGSLSNLEIVACDIHDYIVWGIDLASAGNSWSDNLRIHGNKLHGIGWAYDPLTYYSGYDGNPYHQDVIFDRACTTCSISSVYTGTNRNIYANMFYDDQFTAGNPTAVIYLSDTLSANVYNNVFEDPALSPSWVIAFTCDNTATNFNLVRILNNTFIMNGVAAYSWDESRGLGVWQTNVHVFAANNILYQAAANYCSAIDTKATNIAQEMAAMKLDFNDYFNPELSSYFQWTALTDIPGMRQQYGFETNGIAADPKFVKVSFGFGTGASQNDYHLQTGSPCIGAGTNLSSLNLPGLAVDVTGKARPASGLWDIGAYEH